MQPCKDCGSLIDRKEARENDGVCKNCTVLQVESRKASSDYLTSFGGKGSRGFVKWLKDGKFLQMIDIRQDEAELHWYNDRIHVITQMIGGKYDRLLNEFAKVVLVIAKEETEAND